MKELSISWTAGKSLSEFPDLCIVCMKPTAGHLKPDYSWVSLSLPYCEEHLSKAKLSHDFHVKNFEQDNLAAKIVKWLGWGVAVVVFFIMSSAVYGSSLDSMDFIVSLVVSAIAKGIIHFGLGGLYILMFIKPKSKKLGLEWSDVTSRFLGFDLESSQGEQGQEMKLTFTNEEYGNLYEENVKSQYIKEKDNSTSNITEEI